MKEAGKALRRHAAREVLMEAARHASSVDVLDHWRAQHAYPLQKATMGLRSRVVTERCVEPLVSQRLKRRPTIIDNLLAEAEGLAVPSGDSYSAVREAASSVPQTVLEMVGLRIDDNGLVLTPIY